MKKTAILLATYGRHTRLEWIVKNLRETTSPIYTLYFVVETVDKDSTDEAQRLCSEYPEVQLVLVDAGTSNKAFNLGFLRTTEPFVYLACDDLEFTPGWLESSLRALEEDQGDPTAKVVSTRDGFCSNGKSGYLMTRDYVENHGLIDCPGKILYEYSHYYADEEFLKTAMKRGVFRDGGATVLHHHYSLSSKYPKDSSYIRAEASYLDDARIFESRRHLFA